jgi:hypothetical protein
MFLVYNYGLWVFIGTVNNVVDGETRDNLCYSVSR